MKSVCCMRFFTTVNGLRFVITSRKEKRLYERQAKEKEEIRRAELLAEERRRSAQLESVQSRENSDQHLHQPMPTTNGGSSGLRILGALLLIAGLAITGYFFMAYDTSVERAAFVPVASSQTAMNIAEKAFPSVVMIVMEDANGQSAMMGSGFFVSKGVVASNFHVIEGASRGFVKIIGDKTKYDIDGVIALDEFHDLVLLQVKVANAPLLSLGDSKNLAIGEEVFAVGNPKGFEGTFSQGIVSGIREWGSGSSVVQITAPISHGSSGGPVLNGKAEVIGVTFLTYEDGQNLNFAIPSQYLKELLAKKGDLKPIQSSSKRVTQN